MTMFVFKFDKALQAAAYLLRRESNHEMNYMRLLKVLYVADRESIRQTGRPITGDQIAAMKRGPVLSQVFDLVKGEHLRSPDWEEFIQREAQYIVRLVKNPGQAILSRFEIETLERVAVDHRERDEWDMVDFTHTFPEWIKNNPGDSSKPIPLADVLEAVGRSADLEAIEEDAKEDRAFARVFGTGVAASLRNVG
jgi:uncharacterized phage-associated protein